MKRNTELSTEKIGILLRDVYGNRAHIAHQGEKREAFQVAADVLCGIKYFGINVDGKSVRDRYERMQKAFNDSDKRNKKLSGVKGGPLEAEDLLSMMREARDD